MRSLEYKLVVDDSDESFKNALDNNQLDRDNVIDAQWVHWHNTPDQVPPITLAAGWNKLEKVKYLLAKGADLEATSTRQQLTPLASALIMGHSEMVDYLLQEGANATTAAERLLQYIIDNNFWSVDPAKAALRTLLNHAYLQQEDRLLALMTGVINRARTVKSQITVLHQLAKINQAMLYKAIKQDSIFVLVISCYQQGITETPWDSEVNQICRAALVKLKCHANLPVKFNSTLDSVLTQIYQQYCFHIARTQPSVPESTNQTEPLFTSLHQISQTSGLPETVIDMVTTLKQWLLLQRVRLEKYLSVDITESPPSSAHVSGAAFNVSIAKSSVCFRLLEAELKQAQASPKSEKIIRLFKSKAKTPADQQLAAAQKISPFKMIVSDHPDNIFAQSALFKIALDASQQDDNDLQSKETAVVAAASLIYLYDNADELTKFLIKDSDIEAQFVFAMQFLQSFNFYQEDNVVTATTAVEYTSFDTLLDSALATSSSSSSLACKPDTLPLPASRTAYQLDRFAYLLFRKAKGIDISEAQGDTTYEKIQKENATIVLRPIYRWIERTTLLPEGLRQPLAAVSGENKRHLDEICLDNNEDHELSDGQLVAIIRTRASKLKQQYPGLNLAPLGRPPEQQTVDQSWPRSRAMSI